MTDEKTETSPINSMNTVSIERIPDEDMFAMKTTGMSSREEAPPMNFSLMGMDVLLVECICGREC